MAHNMLGDAGCASALGFLKSCRRKRPPDLHEMKTRHSPLKSPLARRSLALAIFPGALLCLSSAGLVQGAVIVYNDFATGSVSLDDQTATHSGRADFDIGLSFPGGWDGPEPGTVRAFSHYGPGTFNFSGGNVFQTVAFTAAEYRDTRTAQADSLWEFTVVDSDTTFLMSAVVELGALSWTLQDLTLDALVATYSLSGFGGNTRSGILLQGHSYRLTESARTTGTSNELAQLNFSVETDVVFLPSAPNPVPESGAFLTNAVFLLALGGLGWWHRRHGQRSRGESARIVC